MKLQSNVSLKFKAPTVLSIVLVLVIVLELVAVYLFWFQNLKVKIPDSARDNVVRVDLPGYRATIQFLDNINQFDPNPDDSQIPNPFVYR